MLLVYRLLFTISRGSTERYTETAREKTTLSAS